MVLLPVTSVKSGLRGDGTVGSTLQPPGVPRVSKVNGTSIVGLVLPTLTVLKFAAANSISFTALLSVSATKTSPLASTATPSGMAKSAAHGLTVELELTVATAAPPVPATISFTALLRVIGDEDVAAASTATPSGPLKSAAHRVDRAKLLVTTPLTATISFTALL